MRNRIQQLTLLVLMIGLLTVCAKSGMAQGAGAITPQASGPKPVKKVTSHRRANRRNAGWSKPRRDPLAPVSLWVVSKPPNSKVFVDGELKGETNAEGELKLDLIPGRHTIRVARDGYVSSEGEVEVAATREANEVEFTLAQAVTSVNVVTSPTEAEVYLDDVYRGATNGNGLLVIERVNPTQPHTLRVAKNGYESQTVPVTTYAGQISIALVSNSAQLIVATKPAEAEVYLDDVYRGTSTGEGVLVINGMNPNQTHTLRSKKDGYQSQSITIPPNTPEATIKLSPDPVLLLVKSLKQHIAGGRLVEAFEEYNQLGTDAPDNPETSRLLDSLLQNLQARSADLLTRVGPYGLPLDEKKLQEMSHLYKAAQRWRINDEEVQKFGKFWDAKNSLASTSSSENDRRSARSNLLALGEHNLRSPFLLFDLGWTWAKLNEKSTAQKYFDRAQELKPDWAYPYFARGVFAMHDAESEIKKSQKTVKYGQGIENFSKAISLKHDFARAFALRSISYGALKQYEESIRSGLQAVAIDPQSAFAHFALGHAYFQKGKSSYRNALSKFNEALTLDGGELDEGIKSSIQQRLVIIKKSVK
ncbi:MAG TPA: PEGA domain-containing protein [Pyrinomonadaceae bacterium]|nr:PEGA domain-containing protein [Pyrinomonadaceae bacterium]